MSCYERKKIRVWKDVIGWPIRSGCQWYICLGWASLEKSSLVQSSNDCLLNKKYIFGLKNTTKTACRHHATSPFLVYKISNSKYILLKNSHPHRVHRPWKWAVYGSNTVCRPWTIWYSCGSGEIGCFSTRSECLKSGGRKIVRSTKWQSEGKNETF